MYYKLLIVDDDELIRSGLAVAVPWEEMGFFVVHICSNGKEALEYLKYEPVDFLLTDIDMPGMSGLELIEQALLITPGIRSVIISGYRDFEYARTAIELKAEGYVLKPVSRENLQELFLRLKSAADQQRREEEARQEAAMKPEYELMLLLSEKLEYEYKASQNRPDMLGCRVLLLQGGAKEDAAKLARDFMRRKTFSVRLWAYYKNLFAAVVPAQNLGDIVAELEGSLISGGWRAAVGKEIGSHRDMISSFWSAVKLLKSGKKRLSLYDMDQKDRKKQKERLQALKKQIIKEMEEGKNYQAEQLAREAGSISNFSSIHEKYRLLKDIETQIVWYFRIEDTSRYRLFCYYEDAYETADALNRAFLADIQAMLHDLKKYSDSYSKILVNKAIEIIQRDFGNSFLSLASLAAELNVSYAYLSTLFTKIVGKSFTLYLLEIRMEKARQLLLTRQYKIYEIAEKTGYGSSKYFTDVFKKYFGLTPQGYINRIGDENEEK